MKRTLKILIKFLLFVLVLFGVSLSGIFFFEDKIITRVVDEINKSIKVPITVDELNFTIIKNFPNASLELKDVSILSTKDLNKKDFQFNTDSLLTAKSIYLSVNVLKLIKNEVELNKIEIDKAKFQVLIDKSGQDNYSVLQNFKQTNNQDSIDFNIKIKQFQFNNVDVLYINKSKDVEHKIFVDNYQLSGDFYKKKYKINSGGKIRLLKAKQGSVNFTPSGLTNLNLDMYYSGDTIKINKGEFKTQNSQYKLNGSVVLFDNPYLDLRFSGKKISLSKASQMINQVGINKLDLDGQFNIQAQVKGVLSKIKSPGISANVEVENASFRLNTKTKKIENIYFKAHYTNGKAQNLISSKIIANNVRITFKNSFLSGNFSMENFKSPEIRLSSNINFDLLDFNELTNQQIITSGVVKGNFTVAGPVKFSKDFESSNFDNLKNSGSLYFNDLSIKTNDVELKKLKADLSLNNWQINVKQLNTEFNKGRLSLKGSVINLMSYLQNKNHLKIKADITASNIDYNNYKFITNSKNETAEKSTNNHEIIINAKFLIHDFKNDQFVADRFSGILKYGNKQTELISYKLNTCEGLISGNLKYKQESDSIGFLYTHSSMNRINVKSMFAAFKNFGQETLKAEQINGELTTDFELQCKFVNGEVQNSSIDFLGYVELLNGELNNFKPIIEASKFTEIPELENIKFSKIENNLLIAQEVIYIPNMDISSNAFDVNMSGEQNFNGDYKYHLKIFIDDFTSGKAKRLQKQQSEFGVVEDDGYGRKPLLLLAQSEKGKSSVQIDKSAIKRNFKQNLKNEKHELKLTFKKEFGWFKKDTTLKTKTKEQPKFQIEWDDE